jgi:hypothetical protein
VTVSFFLTPWEQADNASAENTARNVGVERVETGIGISRVGGLRQRVTTLCVSRFSTSRLAGHSVSGWK